MDTTKKKIAAAFLVVNFLAAFEGVVVSTAAPVIVKSLHNFELISWIFSLYLLTSAVSTPIYGKLADLYGRKHLLIIGISIFLLGSTLCGISQGMYELIAFRGLQGLGAGSILTICFTMIGDIFTLDERAVIQGGISTVWGIAGLMGPLLGGFLIDYLSWHWIFFVNLPFGLVCIYILSVYVHEPRRDRRPHIDYAGAVFLSVCISSFLYAIMQYNESISLAAAAFAAAIVSGIAFYWQERRAVEPIVPLFILNRPAVVMNVITFGVAFVLISNTVYLPLHMQTLMGYSATAAGLSMVTVSAAWFISSLYLARLMKRMEARYIVMAAAAVLTASSLSLQILGNTAPAWLVPVLMFPFGIGFSGTLNTLVFIIQDSVDYRQRGAAIGINMLTRTIAQSVGVAALGTVINGSAGIFIHSHTEAALTLQNLYDHTAAPYAGLLEHALLFALHRVYFISAGIALLCLALGYFVPKYTQRD